MKTKKQNIETFNGLSERFISQIIRRKMIQKNHGDCKKYNRKDKSWKLLILNYDK